MTNLQPELLKLLFPDGYPEDWEFNVELNRYIEGLGNLKISQLEQEPQRLAKEHRVIVNEIEDVAVKNYQSFLDINRCSRLIFQQFGQVSNRVGALLEHLPVLEDNLDQLALLGHECTNKRRIEAITLRKGDDLLHALKLPHLMKQLVLQELFDNALEVAQQAYRLCAKFSNLPIFEKIKSDIDKCWEQMLEDLVKQLEQNLTLTKSMEVVNYVRRMQSYSEVELRMKFLQARDVWLTRNILDIEALNDVGQQLRKVIEVNRMGIFTILTQYRAVFHDDEQTHGKTSNSASWNYILYAWVDKKISEFITGLKWHLDRSVSHLEPLLVQCMRFGQSLSRFGCDFRPQLIPIFNAAIESNFQLQLDRSLATFSGHMSWYTLSTSNLVHGSNVAHAQSSPLSSDSRQEFNRNQLSAESGLEAGGAIQPPLALLNYYPLAELLNGILIAFNELRLCASLAVAGTIVEHLQDMLTRASKVIARFENRSNACREQLTRFCIAFADDLIPFVQYCIHAIYPTTFVVLNLGVNVSQIRDSNLLTIDRTSIVECINHLLPKVRNIIEEVVLPQQLEVRGEQSSSVQVHESTHSGSLVADGSLVDDSGDSSIHTGFANLIRISDGSDVLDKDKRLENFPVVEKLNVDVNSPLEVQCNVHEIVQEIVEDILKYVEKSTASDNI